MSSSFSPYELPIHPPRGDWLGSNVDLLAPARRASNLMLALGVLALVGGLCVGAAAFLPLDELIRRSNLDLSQFKAGGLSPTQYLRLMFVLTAAFAIGTAAAMLICGALVRRGGSATAIVSVVLVGLLTLLIGVQAIVQMVQASLQPNDYTIGSAIFSLLLLAALVLLITWLASAIRAAGSLRLSRQRQVEQWYAMQHDPAWIGTSAPDDPKNGGDGSDFAATRQPA